MLLAWIALASGCGGPVPPPAAPGASAAPPAAPSAAAVSAPAANTSVVSAAPPKAAPPEPSEPPRLAEPLPPLTRPFVPVTFLQSKAGIIHIADAASMRADQAKLPRADILSVHGRSPEDVWLLAPRGVVIHFDGKRIVNRYTKPCGWGETSEEGYGAHLLSLAVDKDSVRVLGQSRDPFSRVGGDLTASLSRGGKWSCKEYGVAPSLVSSSGDFTWRLSHYMASDTCKLRALDNQCAPVPSWAPSYDEPVGDTVDGGIESILLWMRGLSDGWIVTLSEEGDSAWLLRYNGVTWAPVTAAITAARPVDLWVDDDGIVWLLGGTIVLRYDGKELVEMPTPESFSASMVRGTGPKDVWFVGEGTKVYQWDGEKLRQGTAPFAARDIWSSPGGEVWIVGPDGVARTAPLGGAR